MVWFKYTPHTNYDIRCEVSQGGAPWDAVSMCPKTVSRCPKSVSRCPESVSRCPHFFSSTYFTATSNISQLQALATGICSIQILILVRSTLFSGAQFGVSRYPMWCLKVPEYGVHWDTFLKICFVKKWKVTHFWSFSFLAQIYPTGCCIHMCRQNILFWKLNLCFGGLNFSVSRCPSLPYIAESLTLIQRSVTSVSKLVEKRMTTLMFA